MSETAEQTTWWTPPHVPLTITATDYRYNGVLVGVACKLSGELRYVIEDSCGRLFIHNAKQIGKEEGWLP